MEWQEELVEKLGGFAFEVEDDPDNEGFFSVFAYKGGSGAEVAGKIGERCVAEAIATSLNQLTAVKESGFMVDESGQLVFASEGYHEYLGEWDDGKFVPSVALMGKPERFQKKADHYARAFAPAHGEPLDFDQVGIGDTFRFVLGNKTTLYRKTGDGEYVDEPTHSLHVGHEKAVYIVKRAKED